LLLDNNVSDVLPTRHDHENDDVNADVLNSKNDIPYIIVYIDTAENKALIKAKDKNTDQILHPGTDALDTTDSSAYLLSCHWRAFYR
jgi:hypothetical protein